MPAETEPENLRVQTAILPTFARFACEHHACPCGARNHPVSDAAKEFNRIKSSIRACVEHIFGGMAMSMGGKLTRKIGLEMNKAWWGLKNLTFNFLRYLRRSCRTAVVS